MTRPSWLLLLPICLFVAGAIAEDKMEKKSGDDTSLTSDKQKTSYAIGNQIGKSLAAQGLDLDLDVFLLAIKDAVTGQPARLAPDEIKKIVTSEQENMVKALADKNSKSGDAFRAEYKKKEGVKELPSGLLYRIIKEGSGKKPAASDTVEVNYNGKHINGTEFDSSERNGGPVTFPLGGIIKGWQEALQQMPEGSKWEIVVPPELAYSTKGARGVIGPNETLVFEIELIAIKAKTG